MRVKSDYSIALLCADRIRPPKDGKPVSAGTDVNHDGMNDYDGMYSALPVRFSRYLRSLARAQALVADHAGRPLAMALFGLPVGLLALLLALLVGAEASTSD